MLASCRFVVTTHVMVILARFAGKSPVSSSFIAESVHTNPVVIRRMMHDLDEAELVRSIAGRSGGFELAKPAVDITLADIYLAVEDENIFRMHKTDPATDCPVARQIHSVLADPLHKAELALLSSLRSTSLQAIVGKIKDQPRVGSTIL